MNENVFELLDFTMLTRLDCIYGNEVEDLKQQAFLEAWERRRDIDPKQINKFIRESVRSSFIEIKKAHHKSKKYRRTRSYQPPAEYSLELREFTQKANRIIAKLNLNQRKTLEYKLMDFSIQEIAKKTKTKNGTVMSRLYSIRKKLKDELSEYSDLLA